jgi:hypothetical protein
VRSRWELVRKDVRQKEGGRTRRKLDRRSFGKTETQMKKLGCQMTHIKLDMSKKEEEIDEKLILLQFSEKRIVVIVIHEYNNQGASLIWDEDHYIII